LAGTVGKEAKNFRFTAGFGAGGASARSSESFLVTFFQKSNFFLPPSLTVFLAKNLMR
jgi:hypothetical protein